MGCGDVGKYYGNISDAAGLTNYSGDRAAEAQQNATNQANATAKQIYDQQRKDNEPWRQAGMTALAGIEGNQFMDNWQQQDPSYQNRLDEGLKAVNASASARGMGNSGAAMKALTKYGQDYASNEYSKAYDRNYGRLSQLAGFGSSATSQTNANAGAYGQQVSGNQIGMGNAYASNEIAQSNRLGGFLQSAAGAAGKAYGGGGGGATFSDLRLKTNIEKLIPSEFSEMRSHLKAYAFNYKNDMHGKGDWIGVMAQDLEKSKLGKTLVVEDENGHKIIDTNKVLSMFLATMAEG